MPVKFCFRLFWALLASLASLSGVAYAGSVTGVLQGPSGLPVKNGTVGFRLHQAGLIVGTGLVVPLDASCFTSNDGSVVGLPNPLAVPTAAGNMGSGSLPGSLYYIETTFYSGTTETQPSPELRIQLTGTGTLTVHSPAGFPANAAGMRVYIGTTSGGETLQGATTSSAAAYSQSSGLAAGTSAPVVNSTVCSIAFNDTIIPYSGYDVSLLSASGNAYPGWPQAWQLNGGLQGTIDVSNGAPLWNGVVVYPQPLVAQPLNHGPQSIAGSLNMSGYNIAGVGALGIGTNVPAWPVDVENGLINSSQGYLYNGGAGTAGECLVSNGSAFAPGSCSSAQAYYQRWANAANFVPQEAGANFGAEFTLTDAASSGQTKIDLSATGVVASNYINANITVDSYGRVTAAANGPSIPAIQALVINSGICTTTGTSYGTCTFTAIWPSAFANNNYAATCTEGPVSGVMVALRVTSKTAAGITLQLQNGTADGAVASTLGEIDCIGVYP